MCDSLALCLYSILVLLTIISFSHEVTVNGDVNFGRLSAIESHVLNRSTEKDLKKYSVNLQNIDPEFRVFIDLDIERNHFGASYKDFKATQANLYYNISGSNIDLNFDESLYRSDTPHQVCIRHKPSKDRSSKEEENVIVSSCKNRPILIGIRVSNDRASTSDDGIIELPANTKVRMLLFGLEFSNETEIAFTTIGKSRGSRCDDLPLIKIISLSSSDVLSDRTIETDLSLPISHNGDLYYVCFKDAKETISPWIHQGNEPWLSLKPVGRYLPIELQSIIICFLLILSGLFSGLNLGLMALECTELRVLEKCGTESEKRHASKIYPIRKRSNLLLCSLLLGNVLVNNTLTILLDDLTSGMIAVVLSTFGIVIFGEIIPQAICSRHGLAIGAKTLWVTKLFMLLTFPLSYPISRILDFVLGAEIRTVYNRKRLMEFIRLTKEDNNLQNEEVDIISGALELTKKTVADVMTKINDVFMVPITSVLDFETVSEIMKQGYSRIPVYDGDRSNVVALLSIKDLAFVDPDIQTPLRTLCEFYNHPVNFVFEDTTLDVMLNEFKKGRSHLSLVRRVNNEEDGDPFYELLGIVTLEDVIEEIIQSEIIDETDVLTDNRRKHVRKESQTRQDFSDFARLGVGDKKVTTISPQLALATYQYLSTSVAPFKSQYISESVLKKLMAQDVFLKSKVGKEGYEPSSNVLFQAGKAADYFILILEGRCLVTVSKENLVFEAGPFASFGLPVITMNTSEQDLQGSTSGTESTPYRVFVPDYTVVATGETVYMKVHFAIYRSAVTATLLERQQRQDSDSREVSKAESGRNSQCSNSKDTSEDLSV
ncbi:Metal transporter CNNM4 [Araneus ventricosus]|uniref:Metal transporter CNNM4 n=1 Tax=Araneus ventricosus TaxID=182803 RepID=A0A4Y2CRZ8_ARAVE|nr:Metal transporter CNNM4 [Araneus ventricosus]